MREKKEPALSERENRETEARGGSTSARTAVRRLARVVRLGIAAAAVLIFAVLPLRAQSTGACSIPSPEGFPPAPTERLLTAT